MNEYEPLMEHEVATVRRLVEELVDGGSFDDAQATHLATAFFDTLAAALALGRPVKIDPLGTFTPSPDQQVSFTPSELFASQANSLFDCFGPVEIPVSLSPSEPSKQEPERESEPEPEREPECEENLSPPPVVISMPVFYRPLPVEGKPTALPPPYNPHSHLSAMPQPRETPREKVFSTWLAVLVCLACVALGFIIGIFW